jgi:cysteine desulfurase
MMVLCYKMLERTYLDWNATTPLRPEARAAIAAAWDFSGNPSSVHAEGRQARHLVEEARAVLADALGALPRNVVFTSGGTEANVMALSPHLRSGSSPPVERLLVSAIEHTSVLTGGRFAPERIASVPVTRSGAIDLSALGAMLAGGPPALVSLMAANNETGAVQPVADAAAAVHQAGGLLHVDAIQALGKIPIKLGTLGADLVTVSAHKIGGPKGIGAVVIGEGVTGLEPLLRGGGQERGRRAGTEDVAGIAGFGAAAAAAIAAMAADGLRIRDLRDRLEAGLRQEPDVIVFSADMPRLQNTTLFAAPGMKAETAVISFDLEGVAVSSGSACSSGKVQPSHVLQAMGFSPGEAQGAVRLSLGWSTSDRDVDRCLEAWRKLRRHLVKR